MVRKKPRGQPSIGGRLRCRWHSRLLTRFARHDNSRSRVAFVSQVTLGSLDLNGGKIRRAMHPAQSRADRWLVENGPRELELLFRAVVYHPAAPILIADNDRKYREASASAGKLLGVPREKIIGRKIDDFAEASFKPQISELWRA